MKNLFIVTDPGKDLDDECTLVLACGLARLGLVRILGVVAALVPACKRAQLAKGTLKELGYPDVPVGVGSDMHEDFGASDHEFDGVAYMSSRSEVGEGSKLFIRELTNAPDKSVTLLVLAGMADVSLFMRFHEDLLVRKVEQVVIMGGVNQANDAVALDAGGLMTPDTAANNAFDPEASSYVYRRLQELGIPMIVLSRQAVYASAMPREIYDKMFASGHPVGVKIGNSQRRMVEDLWRTVHLPLSDPARFNLPARFTREWFLQKYCGGAGTDRQASDSIWDIVRTANLYDPMALLAALPDLCDRFYAPQVVRVGGVEHRIIGVSEKVNGLKDRDSLITYLSEQMLAALAC